MRIATSTVFANQVIAMDNTQAQYQQLASELSSGYQLQQPSDDPGQVGQALTFNNAVTLGNQTSTNLTNAQNQLNVTDSALNNLTEVLQSAYTLAVQSASDVLDAAQRQSQAVQVNDLLNQAISIANTTYNGTYIFGGTAANSTPPVTAAGQPNATTVYSGNFQSTGQIFVGNQPINTSVTITQAFNLTSNAANPGYNSTNGSADVFTVLENLRDTLQNGSIVDASSTAVNQPGQAIGLATTLGLASFAQALTPDAAGDYSIQISGANAAGSVGVQTFTFTGMTSLGGVEAAINAASASTGVSAYFDPKQERLFLQGSSPFSVLDVPSPGSTTNSNFTTVFGLSPQATVVNNLSGQLADITNVLNVALNARTNVGSALQIVTQTMAENSTDINNDTQVKSSIEDVDVAKASTQYTATQTQLQAVYTVTSQIEKYSLLSYIS